MLVLTRKVDEALRIGPHIRIHVLAQTGKQVKLGIEAPREVSVVREELYQKVAASNLSAAAAPEEEA